MIEALTTARLQDLTLLLLLVFLGEQSSTGCVLEDFADTLVGFGRAFEVFVSANLLADILSLQGV